MRSFVVLIVTVSLIAGGVAAVAASEEIAIYGTYEEIPSVGRWPSYARGQIAVGHVGFFVIPGNAGGLTLVERCTIVDTRITEILSHGVLGPVRVKAIRGKPTVYVGPYRLITVYPRDVRGADARCSWQLASKWAKSTAQALPKVMPSAFMGPLPPPPTGPAETVPFD